MATKNAADEHHLVKPQGNPGATNTTVILHDRKPEVKGKNKIQRMRVKQHVPVAKMVETVRTLYPGYDKPLHSKVENGDKYGIRLRADAEKLLKTQYAENARERLSDQPRKKPMRIQARLNSETYSLLQRHISDAGITMQDFIEGLILDYIQKNKEESNGNL